MPERDDDSADTFEPDATATAAARGDAPDAGRLPRVEPLVYQPHSQRWRVVAVGILVAVATAALVLLVIGLSS